MMKPLILIVRRVCLLSPLLLMQACAGPLGAPASSASAPSMKWEWATHHRFKALHWTNGVVDLVIVPETGRIMRYGFVGERNVLWENVDPEAMDNLVGDWMNYGGDKLWVWPQKGWPRDFGHDWPPPMDNLPEPYSYVFDGRMLTLRSPPLSDNGLRMVREIELASEGTMVRIRNRLEAAEPITRLTPWQVTQLPPPDEIIARPARDANQVDPYPWTGEWEWRRGMGGLSLFNRITTSAKVGLDADRLAGRFGDLLFICTASTPLDAVYVSGERTQLYYEPNRSKGRLRVGGPYVEFEFTAGRQGDAPLQLEITWSLVRLRDSVAESAVLYDDAPDMP